MRTGPSPDVGSILELPALPMSSSEVELGYGTIPYGGMLEAELPRPERGV